MFFKIWTPFLFLFRRNIRVELVPLAPTTSPRSLAATAHLEDLSFDMTSSAPLQAGSDLLVAAKGSDNRWVVGTNPIGWCGCFLDTKKKWCLDFLSKDIVAQILKVTSSLAMTCFWRFQFTSNSISISLQQALDTQDSSCPDLTLPAATFHHIFLVWSWSLLGYAQRQCILQELIATGQMDQLFV